jgi:diguanylate cyclase (GGDEF)-like protein/PAS domain S-box-containing protein
MWALYFSFGLIGGIVIFKAYFKFAREKSNIILENEQIVFKLVEDSKDVIYHFEVMPELKFTYISPSLEKFIGKGIIKDSFEDPYAPFERIHPDDYENLCKKIKDELDYNQILIQRWKDNEGKYRWFEEYATPIYKNGQLVAVQGIMRNIDEKLELQRNLEYRINHDALTGIYNREYFEITFTKLNEQKNTSIAIILCDLDELKYTNDHFGHKKGDALIKVAARLLNQFSSVTNTVARIGGDEFVLLIEEMSEEEVKQLLNSILKAIESNNGSGTNIIIRLSIGFAFSPNSIGQMTDLFSHADKKMYEDKMKKKREKGCLGDIEREFLLH